jgi:hypothetical protein
MTYDVNIHLYNIADPSQVYVQLQRYLDDRSRVVIRELLEEKAFERKHGDVHLRFSNMDGTFTNIFAQATATTRWEVRIYMVDPVTLEWVIAFRGEVKPQHITFKLDTLWCEFDAFSKTKKFWERAADIRRIFDPRQQAIWAQVEGPDGYITLQNVFSIFDAALNLSLANTIYSGYDLTIFGSRKIRGIRPGPLCSPPIGNEGRIMEIDPSMTLAELLQAFQQKYNAEFYVDHQSGQLVMRRRNVPVASSALNIDSVLMDDQEPEIFWLDENKVDYIYTYSYIFITLTEQSRQAVWIEPPLRQYNQIDEGTHSWICVGFNSSNVAVVASQLLTISLPNPGQGSSGWWVTLSIPSFPADTTIRRLYRRSGGLATPRLVTTIQHNNATTYQDRTGIGLLYAAQEAPNVRNTYNVYRRFDESTWRWQEDIIDNGIRPNGVIFELRPRLRFTEIGLPQLKQEDPYDVWAFFGREQEASLFQDDWRDWFRTRRRIKCKVKNVGYKLNQPVFSSRFPGVFTNTSNYIVKRFESELTTRGNETMLDLLSV